MHEIFKRMEHLNKCFAQGRTDRANGAPLISHSWIADGAEWDAYIVGYKEDRHAPMNRCEREWLVDSYREDDARAQYTIEETFNVEFVRSMTEPSLGNALVIARDWYDAHGGSVRVLDKNGRVIAEHKQTEKQK